MHILSRLNCDLMRTLFSRGLVQSFMPTALVFLSPIAQQLIAGIRPPPHRRPQRSFSRQAFANAPASLIFLSLGSWCPPSASHPPTRSPSLFP